MSIKAVHICNAVLNNHAAFNSMADVVINSECADAVRALGDVQRAGTCALMCAADVAARRVHDLPEHVAATLAVSSVERSYAHAVRAHADAIVALKNAAKELVSSLPEHVAADMLVAWNASTGNV